MAASSTKVPPPSTWSSYGCRYRARAAAVEWVKMEIMEGRGDPRMTWRAHGSRPSAISNPEFRLPMTKIRRPAYSRAGRRST